MASSNRYRTGRADLDASIVALIEASGLTADADLVFEMLVTAIRLGREDVTRGDRKLVNAALKEIRYALGVFAPYRDVRKCSVFGSARTPVGHPEVPSKGFRFADAAGATRFGIGIGSLVLVMNVVLLSGYTLGCHSLRHLVGGYLDRITGRPMRRTAYDCVSCLNRGHMNWAWASLFWVAFTDIYVRMCAMGVWRDWRIL